MARKIKDDDRELYEIAMLLLEALNIIRKSIGGEWPTMDVLIRWAEAALKVRA